MPMKFLILIVFALSFCIGKPKPSKVNVEGKITYTESYCQGMRPTEEILAEKRRQKPLAGKKLYIRKGKVNFITTPIIAEVITDSAGIFKLNLPKGEYCLVADNKKDDSFYNSIINKHSRKTDFYGEVNKECLDEWIKTPDLIFEVGATKTSISYNFHFPCEWSKIPCTTYTGPLPP
jgi:hypothetical protein